MSTPALSKSMRRRRTVVQAAKTLLLLGSMLGSLLGSLLPAPAAAQADDWRPVAPGVEGVEYRAFYGVDGTTPPDPIHVARMDRSKNNLTLESLIGKGYINPTNTISGLWPMDGVQPAANILDETINYWQDPTTLGEPEWGNLSQVLVAINGDHRIENSSLPVQGHIQSGWFAWHFFDNQDQSGLGIKQDGTPFIGNCVQRNNAEQRLIYDIDVQDVSDYYWRIDKVNVPRNDQTIFLYTPQYGVHPDRAWPNDRRFSTEVTVRLSRPLSLGNPIGTLTTPGTLPTDVITGTVTNIQSLDRNGEYYPTGAPLPSIEFDEIVVSGYGTASDKLDNLALNQKIGINLTLNDGLTTSCITPSGFSWANTYTAIGADDTIVENGTPINIDKGIAPRTAFAYNDQYIYFIVAEGHPYTYISNGHTINSRTGISIYDLAKFISGPVLNAEWASDMDGGGSSTMIVNGFNVVHTTDFYYCPQYFASSATTQNTTVQNSVNETAIQAKSSVGGRTIINRQPTAAEIDQMENYYSPSQPASVQDTPYYLGAGTGLCQRRVPNGIAMVAVQPKKSSAMYSPQPVQAFQVLRGLQVRQGPGKNYALLSYIPYDAGSPATGVVIQDSHNLNGVYATGTYWWYVEIHGMNGWVDQNQITPNISLPANQQRLAPDSGGN